MKTGFMGEDFDDDIDGDLDCPNCGCEYDEIDFEYQICTICGFSNNPKPLTPPNRIN